MLDPEVEEVLHAGPTRIGEDAPVPEGPWSELRPAVQAGHDVAVGDTRGQCLLQGGRTTSRVAVRRQGARNRVFAVGRAEILRQRRDQDVADRAVAVGEAGRRLGGVGEHRPHGRRGQGLTRIRSLGQVPREREPHRPDLPEVVGGLQTGLAAEAGGDDDAVA